MTSPKEPTTYQEQIEILRARGCVITDESFCMEKLSVINYYRFSAYFLPFKNSDDSYAPGNTFEKIYHIYEFDRKLRNILLGAIEVIEISFRTRLSYLHGHNYGPLGYRNSQNFNSFHNASKFKENIESAIKNNQKIPFVQHHLKKYKGDFPIWVISELFTFGMISYFYSDLHTADQKEIAKQFKVNYNNLKSWLRCLTDLRNICAHYGRLYYRVFSASPANLDLSEDDKRRLWGIMLVLKFVYPSAHKWNSEFLPLFCKLFAEYKGDIDLCHIAFPEDWLTKLQK